MDDNVDGTFENNVPGGALLPLIKHWEEKEIISETEQELFWYFLG